MMTRQLQTGIAVLLASLAGCSAKPPATQQDRPQQVQPKKKQVVLERPADEDCRKLVVGVWNDKYKGRRELTVRPDGTATMVVEPAGLSGKLFAARMVFQEEWRIEDGKLVMKAVGGEPASKVKLILKTMGDTSTARIVKLNKEQMMLLDSDGKTVFDWRRGKSPPIADED